MHRMKVMAVAVVLFGAIIATNSTRMAFAGVQEKSLFERLGGIEAIKAVVNDFAGRVLADDRVNKKFAKSDPARLVLHLQEQVCAATGGPCEYTGRDMKSTHKNMKVTEGEFKALVEDLVATLDKFKVPEKEKGELLAILGGLHDQIVEVKSDGTGTALPSNFKPAPALPKGQTDAGPKMKGSKM